MATGSRSLRKIIGLALVILGIGLAIWGYQLSTSITSEISEALTGSHTDKVMTYYIGGAISFFVGLFLFRNN